MNEQQRRQLDRERALYRYSCALERGDFDTVQAILREAEEDPTLEQMILEINDIYDVESDEAGQAEDIALVRRIIAEHLPSGIPADVEPTVPALTVGDVMARIQTDAAVSGQVAHEMMAVTQQLRAATTPLPEDLSQRSVMGLLGQLGVSVSKQFLKLFRDTAIFLSMGREQGMARMAATRRQQQQRSKSQPEKEQD